jgi:hypothetical protein
MKLIRLALPISPKYDSPIFEALALQIVLGLVSLLILDFGMVAQVCGIALVAFWGGAAVLIWRHPQSPSRADLELIRFGYLLVVVITYILVGWIWHLRGVVR